VIKALTVAEAPFLAKSLADAKTKIDRGADVPWHEPQPVVTAGSTVDVKKATGSGRVTTGGVVVGGGVVGVARSLINSAIKGQGAPPLLQTSPPACAVPLAFVKSDPLLPSALAFVKSNIETGPVPPAL
jgi:hypothetical protein